MVECPECGEYISDEDYELNCLFCGYEDYSGGYYECYNCGTLFDHNGNIWECENCYNEGITPQRPRYIDYDDEYCEDGIPDVNQGWVGENYG